MKLHEIWDPNILQTGMNGEKYLEKKDFLHIIYDSTLPHIVWTQMDALLHFRADDYPIYARMIGDIIEDCHFNFEVDPREILELTGLWDAGHHEFK